MDERMMNRKAVILGANGLIGTELVQLLVENKSYAEIHVIGRRNIDLSSSKIQFHQVDMEHILQRAELFDVNDVFCCLGTTMKTAGTKEKFHKVDYDMVVNAAKASEGHADQFVMISSLGAKANTSNFYLRTKGEAEKAVLALKFQAIHILRPSILYGNRKEKRTGEKVGIVFMKMMSPILQGPLKKYRGNDAKVVARAMIQYAVEGNPGKFIHESREIEASLASKK